MQAVQADYGAMTGEMRCSINSVDEKLLPENPAEWRRFSILLSLFLVVILVLFGLFVVYPADQVFNDTQYVFYLDVTIMMLVGFGFLMTFMRDYGLGAVGFTFLITIICIPWAILTGRFFSSMAHNVDDYPDVNPNGSTVWTPIAMDINALLNGNFAAAAVLISFGAVIGKLSPSQIALLAMIEVPLYSFNKEVLCVGGFGTLDMGGTMFIHLFGAYFGLAVAWMMGPPKSEHADNAEPSRVSDVFSLIGTVFLWIYWPSFNGATAPQGQQQQGLTTVNTVLALCGSTLATFIMSSILNKRINTVDIQNATLAGGVCVGAASNLNITPVGAILVGVASGALSSVGFNRLQSVLEDKISLHDSCGVHNLHGMPALLGSLVVTVAVCIPQAQGTVKFTAVNQPLAQAAGAAATFGFAIVSGLITGLVLKKALPPLEAEPSVKPFKDDGLWTTAEKCD